MKKLLVATLLLLMIGSTTLAFAWWDRLEQGADNQTLHLGYGVRLVLDNQTSEDQGVLVPEGSFYADVEGYVTSYTFTYVLSLEEELDNFDLLIDVTNLTIGNTPFWPAPMVHGPLQVLITTSAGAFEEEGYDTLITGPETHLRLNQVLQGDGEVTIEITFTLANHVNDAPTQGFMAAAYAALAGKTIRFDIAFEIPTHEHQSDPSNFTVFPNETTSELFELFLLKDPTFNIGEPPYEAYNVSSWNGFLEKLFEVGPVEDDTRLSETSPLYAKNTWGIENPYGEEGYNQLVLNMLNTGVFSFLRNSAFYQGRLPVAILITNDARFDQGASNSVITNNLDILQGTLIIYKNNEWDNQDTQVYTVLEDGERSELMSIQELFDLMP